MSGVSNLSNSEFIHTVLTASRLMGGKCFFPSSYQQQGLWLVEQMNPGHATYNIPFGCHLYGELDTGALEKALRFVIKKYETFRTTFGVVDGSISQIVWDNVEFLLPYIEIENNVLNDPRESAISLANSIVQQAFDITQGPLFRFALIRIQPREMLFVASIHHMVFDGVSVHPFLSELSDLYTQIAINGADVSSLLADQVEIQYADYAVWQREKLTKDYEAKLIDFWKKELTGVNTLLELPSDYPRPAVQAFDGDLVDINFEPDLIQQLNKVARDNKTSLYVVILSALYVLLYRYTKQETILIGSPFADRSLSELENAFGFFAYTIVLKGDLRNEPTFSELIQRIRESVLTAQENQDLPFETLVEKLHPTRDRAFNPFFQVMFGLQSLSSTPSFGNLESRFVRFCTKTSMFDLFFDLREERGGIHGIVEFATSLFAKESIVRLVAQYEKTLQEIVKNPNQPISQISILPEEEKRKLLVEWNDTYCNFSNDKCLHQLFETQTKKNPDAVAVVFENQQMTYRQLNVKSNQLAHYLRSQNVGPDVLVGICMERSIEMMIGLLGILKAGGAYVPIDPGYPQERITFMLEDAQPALSLIHSATLEVLPEDKHTINMDSEWEKIAQYSEDNPQITNQAHNLAYVIYTSGSTGKPKGACLPHQGVVNRLEWMQRQYQLDTHDRILQKTPFSFDVSVWELFWPLLEGARLVVAPPNAHKDGKQIAQIIKDYEITFVHFVPSMLSVFLDVCDVTACQTLKYVICSGEALSAGLQKKFFKKLPAVQLHNLYGPTEASIDVTMWACEQDSSDAIVPIGRPISNTQIYLLDTYLNPVPVGVPGELFIGGVGLARGYLNRPELTDERFIGNPFSTQPGERLYRTGDLARYRSDGNIEYLGRLDNQVKVRGFRIELGEIESVLVEQDSITNACVVVREERVGDPRIYAYIVLAAGKSITPSEIRKKIKQKLPDYMIPQYFIELDQLPLTPNGKIDKKALPLAIATLSHEVERIAPCNDKEKILVKIWAEVIDIPHDQISIDDNFFEIGGTSLLAVQMFSRIEESTGKHFPISTLFKASTVRQLAALINDNVDKKSYIEAGTDQHPVKVNSKDDVTNGSLWPLRDADIGSSIASTTRFTSIVPIQTDGHKIPLFLMHGAGGNVLMYRFLAKHLGPERPIYGFESVGLNQSDSLHKSIEEMGRHYVDEIMTIQAEGPYIVGGYCMGGVIALEVAQNLKKRGKEVSCVILFDSVNLAIDPKDRPYINFYYRCLQLIQYHWQCLWQHDQGKKLNYIRETVKSTSVRALRRAMRILNRDNTAKIATEADKNRYIVWQTNEQAVRSYVPEKYEGKMVLFKQYDRFGYSRELGWEEVAVNGMDMEIFPASPESFLDEPYVASLARSVKQYLDRL